MLKVSASLALLIPAVPLLGLDSLAHVKPTVETSQAQEPAWLGISLGETELDGVLVNSVTPGSPAERAGLETGDRIEAADEQELSDSQALIGLMTGKRPGDALILDVVREGRTMTLLARLIARPEAEIEETLRSEGVIEVELDREVLGRVEDQGLSEDGHQEQGAEQQDRDVGSLFRPREQADELAQFRALVPVDPSEGEVADFWARASVGEGNGYLGVFLEDTEEGVGVTSVEPGSAAQQAGVRAGDVILRFNQQPIRESGDLVEQVRSQAPGSGVKVIVKRGGEQVELQASLGSRESETIELPGQALFQPAESGVRVFQVPTIPGVPAVPNSLFGGQRGNQGPLGGFDVEAFERDMENWAQQFESSFEGWAEQFEDEMEEFSEQIEEWGETFGEAVENDVEMFLGELPDMLQESEVVEKLIDGAARGQALQQRFFSGPESTRTFRVERDEQPGGNRMWRRSDESAARGLADADNFFTDEGGAQVRSQGKVELRTDESKVVERLADRIEAMERELDALRYEHAELRRRLNR